MWKVAGRSALFTTQRVHQPAVRNPEDIGLRPKWRPGGVNHNIGHGGTEPDEVIMMRAADEATVLVVDDDEDMRTVFMLGLARDSSTTA